MSGADALLLLAAMARYFESYPEEHAPTMTCRELAGHLIQSLDDRQLAANGLTGGRLAACGLV